MGRRPRRRRTGLPAETWKQVPGLPLEVSDTGNARTIDRTLRNGRRQPGQMLTVKDHNSRPHGDGPKYQQVKVRLDTWQTGTARD